MTFRIHSFDICRLRWWNQEKAGPGTVTAQDDSDMPLLHSSLSLWSPACRKKALLEEINVLVFSSQCSAEATPLGEQTSCPFCCLEPWVIEWPVLLLPYPRQTAVIFYVAGVLSGMRRSLTHPSNLCSIHRTWWNANISKSTFGTIHISKFGITCLTTYPESMAVFLMLKKTKSILSYSIFFLILFH